MNLAEARSTGSKYYTNTKGRRCFTSSRCPVDKSYAKFRKYARENREKEAARLRGFFSNNPGLNAAYCGLYQARCRTARPEWLTRDMADDIKSFYEDAHELTELTGVEYQVDHIQPLHGADRCGLHVPWNLQLLTATDNQSKGNRI